GGPIRAPRRPLRGVPSRHGKQASLYETEFASCSAYGVTTPPTTGMGNLAPPPLQALTRQMIQKTSPNTQTSQLTKPTACTKLATIFRMTLIAVMPPKKTTDCAAWY